MPTSQVVVMIERTKDYQDPGGGIILSSFKPFMFCPGPVFNAAGVCK